MCDAIVGSYWAEHCLYIFAIFISFTGGAILLVLGAGGWNGTIYTGMLASGSMLVLFGVGFLLYFLCKVRRRVAYTELRGTNIV